MKYVEINETKRIGYQVTLDYDGWYLLEDAVNFSENKLYCKYTDFTENLTELSKELSGDITLKQVIGYGLEEEIVETLSYTSGLDYFDSEEWEQDSKNLTAIEILAKDIKGLDECLEDYTFDEIWGNLDYMEELIENGTINEILRDKEILVNYWRGCNQSDYEEVYTLIEYKTEEEKAKKELNAQVEFDYIANLLDGNIYSFYLEREELIHYREVNGTRELKQWDELDCDGYGGIVCEYEELEEELTRFLAEELTTEELDKVLSQGLDIEVKY